MKSRGLMKVLGSLSLLSTVGLFSALVASASDTNTAVTRFNISPQGLEYSYTVGQNDIDKDKYFAIYNANGELRTVTKNKQQGSMTGDFTGCTFKLCVWDGMTPSSSAVTEVTSDELINLNFDNGDLSSTVGYGKATGNPIFTEVDGRKCIQFDGTSATVVKLFAADGGSLLTGQEEMTISFDIKPTTEDTSWWFYAAPNAGTQWYPYEHYLGAMTNSNILTVQRWNNDGWRTPVSDVECKSNEWNNVKIFVKNGKTTVYINGFDMGTVDSDVNIADLLGSESVAYIGLANWGSGEYSTGYMDNFVIYDHAADMELELGDLSRVITDITLPAVLADGTPIAWTSSNTEVISNDGKVTRSENTRDVILTATATIAGMEMKKAFKASVLGCAAAIDEFTAYAENKKIVYTGASELAPGYSVTVILTDVNGNTLNKSSISKGEFENLELGKYTVKAQLFKDEQLIKETAKKVNIKEEKEMGAYLFVHFVKWENAPECEQIYFSVSKNGIDWKTVGKPNENPDTTWISGVAPILTSNVGEKGVRDPYILRGEDGKFFIIATDLSINGLYGQGIGDVWGHCQTYGSKSIVVWESEDLVNWSEARLVKVSNDNVGNTWAPEAIYDIEKDAYMVFWASKTAEDDYKTQRIYRSYTKDFITFTEPELYIDGNGIDNIDTTIVEDKGIYYRFTKDAGGDSVTMMSSTSLDSGWKAVSTYTINGVAGEKVPEYEGPAIYKLNGEEKWCLLLDHYLVGGGYKPFVTEDLSKGEFTSMNDFNFDNIYRHGTVMPITDEEYEAIIKAYP